MGTQAIWMYILCVFPQGITLDNKTFSEDDDEIELGVKDLIVKHRDIETELTGVVVFWKIACAGGTRINKNKDKKKKADLFKKGKQPKTFGSTFFG